MVIVQSDKKWKAFPMLNGHFHPQATSGGATNPLQQFSSATASSPNLTGLSALESTSLDWFLIRWPVNVLTGFSFIDQSSVLTYYLYVSENRSVRKSSNYLYLQSCWNKVYIITRYFSVIIGQPPLLS